MLGIDSLSSLGIEKYASQDVANLGATQQVAYHAKKIREYLRDRVGRFDKTQTVVMLASHETARIPKAGDFNKETKSSLAQEAIGIHATFGLDLDAKKWILKEQGTEIGSIITLYTFKNKVSPRHRKITLYLDFLNGFDMVKTDADFLLGHPESPLAERYLPKADKVAMHAYRHSGRVFCRAISDKPFSSDEDFLRAFYANEPMLQWAREVLRIRGFGFDFEKMFMNTPNGEMPDAAEQDAEAAKGYKGLADIAEPAVEAAAPEASEPAEEVKAPETDDT